MEVRFEITLPRKDPESRDPKSEPGNGISPVDYVLRLRRGTIEKVLPRPGPNSRDRSFDYVKILKA